ncbi:hypothetical protein, partial [Mycobacterium tuberculosis]|uniref:hypothetical protein n=1 Tax=Mycobacterium tuberculosis TaxID=1773 RepID=UPI0007106F37
MADRLNVAERLAEGRPAAEHTQSYVRACHLVGYQHPDLTAYPAQIHDWYGSEDGLDLHALDADCAQLRAAASVLMEALRMERSQVAVLAAAWTGSGADAAVHFVQRHCETGNSVVTEVRAAAQRCESLRDNLWQLVDSKVATAIAIDERALAQRPAWLAAAEALTTEGADRPTAVEVVRQQIQPYVDDDVRNDWLTTMRSTTAGVAASYDAVTDQLASAPRAHFEIPDDLGPGRQPSPASVPAQPSATAAITPAAALPPPDPVPAVTSRPVTPSDFGSAPGDGSATPAGVGSAGGFGDAGGTGGLGGFAGLAGLANRIVDAVDSLLGSVAEQLGDPLAADNPPGAVDPFAEDAADNADDGDDAHPEEADEAAEPKEATEPDEADEVDDADESVPAERAQDVAEEATLPPVAEPPPPSQWMATRS